MSFHVLSRRNQDAVRNVTVAFGVGWTCWWVQTLVAGDAAWLWLHSAQLGSALLLVLAMRWRALRRVSQVTAVVFPIALLGLYVAVRLGYLQGLGFYSGPRAYLWYDNPNPFAGSLVMSSAVASVALSGRRVAAGLLLAVGLVGSVAAQVRGSAVAALVATGVWIWTRFRGTRRWAAVAAFIGSLVVLGAVLVWYDPPGPRGPVIGVGEIARFDLRDVLGSATASGGGALSRVHAYVSGIRLFLAEPIAGVGFDGFVAAYQARIAPEAPRPLGSAHNLPIHLLAVGGLLGFFGWAVPVATALWSCRRRLGFLMPVLAAAFWLNTIEVAFFWSGSFYGFWLAVGWALYGMDDTAR